MDRNEKEILAEEVRKYPLLYDQNSPYYKDKEKKEQAWKCITVALGYEEGEAIKEFASLKEEYSKKQIEWKNPNLNENESNSEEESEYKFLTWLQPHLNNIVHSDVEELMNSEDDTDDDENDEDENGFDFQQNKTKPKEPLKGVTSPSSLTGRKRNYIPQTPESLLKRIRIQSSSCFQQNIPTSHMYSGYVNGQNQEDTFGNMVAAELKSFPPHIKVQVKHDIQNVLYKHQMFQLQQMHSNLQAAHGPGHYDPNLNIPVGPAKRGKSVRFDVTNNIVNE